MEAAQFERLGAETVVDDDRKQLGYPVGEKPSEFIGDVLPVRPTPAGHAYKELRHPNAGRTDFLVSGKYDERHSADEVVNVGREPSVVVAGFAWSPIDQLVAKVTQHADLIEDLGNSLGGVAGQLRQAVVGQTVQANEGLPGASRAGRIDRERALFVAAPKAFQE